ncbi:MAG TPA: radical SAM protein [Thermoanaerobaculia bacterium]|nr:radical SAM protein [Thermoanaerobaculia bacterium]
MEPRPGTGNFSLALVYANGYEIGMSSLGFQRVYQLVGQRPGWQAERFFTDGSGMPLSVESDRPLSSFGAVAFSVSFEEDYVNLLQLLDRARIPLFRHQRGGWDPLIIQGGSCASINPLPLADLVDVFTLGAAENTLPALLAALEEESGREAVLERLAGQPGFFVPAHHHPEEEGFAKLEKLELTAEQFRQPGHLPTTAIVTPHTEFANKFLVEMSRGCPEKCKYCWATFGMGTFRWHPTEYILGALERARPVTDQVGFVATAVGDHPEVERILGESCRMGFRASVSSIRIPAVTEGVLEALFRSGDRSITLAPETGSDRLRAHLNKPIKNATLLEKVRLIFEQGFTQLKLYFLVGVPGETLEDVQAILDLAQEARAILVERGRRSGQLGHLHLGTNILVPKPFTPWQREPMAEEASLKEKLALLKRGVARMPNVSMSGGISIRQAIWQTYLSKSGPSAAPLLVAAARGQSLASLLREHEEEIRPVVFGRIDGECRWHFLRQRNTSLPAQERLVGVS